MISCSELRIGNYIMIGQQLHLIEQINATEAITLAVKASGTTDTQAETHLLSQLNPLPLSTTLLQQCGFVYHNYFQFWQLIDGTDPAGRSEIDIDPDYNLIDFMRRPLVRKLRSLHQLQNIYFMLKGRELRFRQAA